MRQVEYLASFFRPHHAHEENGLHPSENHDRLSGEAGLASCAEHRRKCPLFHEKRIWHKDVVHRNEDVLFCKGHMPKPRGLLVCAVLWGALPCYSHLA